MKNIKTPTKIAIIRGVQPRMSELNFYSHFKHLKVKMIGDKNTGWINEKQIPSDVEFVHSPLKPAFLFDPWTTFLGPLYAHRSWQFNTDLEKLVADCRILNISDIFYFYSWQTARIAAKTGKKLVAIVWETLPHHLSTYIPPYSFGVHKVIQTTDLFIARSKQARHYLLSIGVKDRKIKVIYKGIDLSVFNHYKGSKRRSKITILYIGQLVSTKGINELLSAFQRLCLEYKNLQLILCGRSIGEELAVKVKKMAKSLPIKLYEQLDYDKIPSVYQSADIYCQLSQDWRYLGLIKGGNDWFPYAVLEAMASGLPVIATSVGGIPEQLGDDGNIYVKQKNAKDVYKALKQLIDNKKLRTDIGKKNRIRAEKLFDIKKQAKQTELAILENC